MGSKPSLYIKLVKRARKFLRSNFMRRFPFLVKLLRPLFEREYWVPTPHRMAMGLSIGVFFAFAMLIIPIQMLCAAVTCLFIRANLPLALGACWISNPFTIPPLMLAMVWVGEQFEHLGADLGQHEVDLGIGAMNYAHFMVGCVTSGIILALAVYPVYMLCWLLWPSKKNKGKE